MRLDSCPSCVRNRHAALAATVAAMLLAGAPAASAQVGWLPPPAQISSISGSLGALFEPQIAADPAGNAVAVWMELDPTTALTVYSARYVAAAGAWLAAERRSALDAISAGHPRVAVDAAGQAIVMWEQVMPGTTSAIVSTTYNPSAGTWTAPEVRSIDNAQGVQIAMNAAGDAVAVWSVYAGLGGSVSCRGSTRVGYTASTVDVDASRTHRHRPRHRPALPRCGDRRRWQRDGGLGLPDDPGRDGSPRRPAAGKRAWTCRRRSPAPRCPFRTWR